MKVVTIFIENKNNQFLIQKRSKNKNGKYGITSGHMKNDEENTYAAIREIREELGLEVKENELNLFCKANESKNNYYLYYLKKDFDIKDLYLQKSEVDEVHWYNFNEIKNIINRGEFFETQIEALELFQQYREKSTENIKK